MIDTMPEDTTPSMTPAKALVTLAGVVAVITIFLVICHFLHITQYWSGFMFVLYWGMIEKVDTKKLPDCIIGGVAGLLAAYSAPMLAGTVGEASGLVFLGIILVIVFCMLMGWLKVAINAMTMIFITVGTIPAVAEYTSPLNALAGFAAGVIFFGGFICAGKTLKAKAQREHS